MSQASDYLEVELRKHLFRTGSFTKPTVLGIALFTVAPSDAGGGTEVAGGSYARVNVAPLDANWTASSTTSGQTTNANAITFPAPTANWGTVVEFGIFDALSGGNLLLHGQVSPAIVVNSGGPAPTFPAGSLQVTIA